MILVQFIMRCMTHNLKIMPNFTNTLLSKAYLKDFNNYAIIKKNKETENCENRCNSMF